MNPKPQLRAKLLAALHEGPGTSFELAATTELPLRTVAPTLQQMFKAKKVKRSIYKVRLHARSPGAYMYYHLETPTCSKKVTLSE